MAVLFVAAIASEIFLLRSSSYFALGVLIFVFCLPAGSGIGSYFAGTIFEIYGHKLTASFFKSAIAQFLFIFLFLDSLFSIVSLVSRFAALLLDPWLMPLLLISSAAIVNRFGNNLIKGENDQVVGLVAKRLAVALGIFVFSSLLSMSFMGPEAIWLSYPLNYAGFVYAILSISPLIAYSKRTESFREAGLYLMNSSVTWTVIAFFLGIGALVLTVFQNSIIAYAVILSFGAIGVGLVAYKVYTLGASRIAAETQNVYQKHVHQLVVIQDESFDFLRRNINEFVGSGRKENLLIALTTLLVNAGFSFDQSQRVLHMISIYEVPPIHKIPFLSMKKSLDLEVQRRITLVNETINRITRMTAQES